MQSTVEAKKKNTSLGDTVPRLGDTVPRRLDLLPVEQPPNTPAGKLATIRLPEEKMPARTKEGKGEVAIIEPIRIGGDAEVKTKGPGEERPAPVRIGETVIKAELTEEGWKQAKEAREAKKKKGED